jgi:DNA-binding CsgD family transcriptional regulator
MERSSHRERALSDLCYDVVSASSLEVARPRVLEQLAGWFSLDQAIWVAEPRSIEPPTGEVAPFLGTLLPIERSLFEPIMAYRHENLMLREMIKSYDAGSLVLNDVISRKEASRNPFIQEVCVHMGLREMMAAEMTEGRASRGSIFAAVLGRDGRAFSRRDCEWLDRIRWGLSPLLTYRREQAERLAWAEQHAEVVHLLTPREREIFHWIRQGKRNKEIAIIASCSPRTVEKHVESILRKTNSETRNAAAYAAEI